MRILITGGKCMLGRSLLRELSGHECLLFGRELDVRDAAGIDQAVARLAPQVVIHCAAASRVDDLESDPELAFSVNRDGAANVARACARNNARMIDISTDYVFSGDLDRPYHEGDVPGPVNVYGASKLAGEQAVAQWCPDHLILRVAWLFGEGGPSFVHRMLDLGRQDGPTLKVVRDQVGNPTSAAAVAHHVLLLLETSLRGVVHLTCEGEASWYDLCVETFRLAGVRREVAPCTSSEFQRPAHRPKNSRLEKRVLRTHNLPPMPHWKKCLEALFRDMPHE